MEKLLMGFSKGSNIYYSVDAGSSGYPIETYDQSGSLLSSVAQGNDYRGLWWNDSTQQLEGNSYNGYAIVSQNLSANGYPLGVVTNLFIPNTQPDPQSCGVYDYNHGWVLYNNGGTIFEYERYTNVFAGSFTPSGLPGTTINTTSLIYTGCAGMEIGLYDYMNSKIYFINQATASYSSQTQLPPTSTTNDRFRFAFANNMIWVFDPNLLLWQSYNIFQPSGITENNFEKATVFPNPFSVLTNFNFGRYFSNAELKIFEMNGKEVKHIENISGNSFALNRSDLLTGIYYYTVTEKKSGSIHGKLMVE
jgi:hypothetical protein